MSSFSLICLYVNCCLSLGICYSQASEGSSWIWLDPTDTSSLPSTSTHVHTTYIYTIQVNLERKKWTPELALDPQNWQVSGFPFWAITHFLWMGGSKLRKTVRQKWAFTTDISINMSFHPQGKKNHKKFELRANHTWTNNAVKNTNWFASSKPLVSQVFNFHQNILCLLEKVCVEKEWGCPSWAEHCEQGWHPRAAPHCTSRCAEKAPGEA